MSPKIGCILADLIIVCLWIISCINTVSPKKIQKRKYITTRELQQQQQNSRKTVKKTPEAGQRYALRSSPTLLPSQQDASPTQGKDKGSARRKLQLQESIIPEKEVFFSIFSKT